MVQNHPFVDFQYVIFTKLNWLITKNNTTIKHIKWHFENQFFNFQSIKFISQNFFLNKHVITELSSNLRLQMITWHSALVEELKQADYLSSLCVVHCKVAAAITVFFSNEQHVRFCWSFMRVRCIYLLFKWFNVT